jgi:hypothetical protein
MYEQNISRLVLEEVKDVIDDSTDYQGARMVFVTMNSIDISGEANMLTLITTHLSRGSKKMLSVSVDIKQKECRTERLLEPRMRHKLEGKLVVRGEVIR